MPLELGVGAFTPAIRILENEYVGEVVSPKPPDTLFFWRGPYKQRKLKRWYRAHPAYYRANGTVYTMEGGRTVMMHPDDARTLRTAIAAYRPPATPWRS